MNHSFRHDYISKMIRKYTFFIMLLLFSTMTFSQVATEIDTTKIKIGEQINYKIKVEADTTSLVVFPDGQTFMPLEMVEASKVDTTKKNAKYEFLKTYALTQFDSGAYTIPRQKIIIGDRTFYTDSLKVEVNTVKVDTTKQGLYDIKPIIEVEKSSGKWWKYLLIALLIIALIAFLLYWFIWRKKPLTEEEEIALLPPYDRAKLAIKKLENSRYLINSEVKAYYSELTMIIRKYLDEKVYDRALESTTDELIGRLELLKEGNQIPLTKETIANLESILKRADLVKFAKSKPDMALAEMDMATIDKEIDNVKQTLPEPSEEEKLLDKQYKEEQERKKKRKKIIITVVISVALIIATFIGFGLKYGFGYVKDTIIGQENKELLEGNWVNSAYGFPPIYISTPKVLKRTEVPIPEEVKEKMTITSFSYGTLQDVFSITVNTTTFNMPESKGNPQQAQGQEQEANKIDLLQVSEATIKKLEEQGATDIIVKREQFITPNAAEGLKTFGNLNIKNPETDTSVSANYVFLHFTTENVLQQIVIIWPEDDDYADEMAQRIIDSVELKKVEEDVK